MTVKGSNPLSPNNILSRPGREKYIIHLPKKLLTNGVRYVTIGLPKGRKEIKNGNHYEP